MSLKLWLETLHSMDLDWFGNSVKIAKKPVTAPIKRQRTNTLNCPGTGATITLAEKHTMKKIDLQISNLHRDQKRCSTAVGSPLKMLGFTTFKTFQSWAYPSLLPRSIGLTAAGVWLLLT